MLNCSFATWQPFLEIERYHELNFYMPKKSFNTQFNCYCSIGSFVSNSESFTHSKRASAKKQIKKKKFSVHLQSCSTLETLYYVFLFSFLFLYYLYQQSKKYTQLLFAFNYVCTKAKMQLANRPCPAHHVHSTHKKIKLVLQFILLVPFLIHLF